MSQYDDDTNGLDWYLETYPCEKPPQEKESSHSINRRNKNEVLKFAYENLTHRFYKTSSGSFKAIRKDTKIMKITHKFYVGSRTIVDGQHQEWAKKTLTEAIKHAQELAEETEQDQIVVQIVRVVRVQKRPTIVEKV